MVILYKGQHGFRPGYSCKSQSEFARTFLILLDERARTDAIMIDFTEAFDLVLHDQQITKISASGVDMRAGSSQVIHRDSELQGNYTWKSQ